MGLKALKQYERWLDTGQIKSDQNGIESFYSGVL